MGRHMWHMVVEIVRCCWMFDGFGRCKAGGVCLLMAKLKRGCTGVDGRKNTAMGSLISLWRPVEKESVGRLRGDQSSKMFSRACRSRGKQESY
jgi:hypothetical protein